MYCIVKENAKSPGLALKDLRNIREIRDVRDVRDVKDISKPGRFCIFFNNTIHYTIFQSIGLIQYNTNTIQYLKELYPICNNILIHLKKFFVES